MSKALVIPHDITQSVRKLDLPDSGSHSLSVLQATVGGYIEVVPLPEHADPTDMASLVCNEDGKLSDPPLPPNRRATMLMAPGIGIQMTDYIAGDAVVVGYDDHGEITNVPGLVELFVQFIVRFIAQAVDE